MRLPKPWLPLVWGFFCQGGGSKVQGSADGAVLARRTGADGGSWRGGDLPLSGSRSWGTERFRVPGSMLPTGRTPGCLRSPGTRGMRAATTPPGNQPRRQTHLDHHNQCPVFLKRRQRTAKIICTRHGGPPSQIPKVHSDDPLTSRRSPIESCCALAVVAGPCVESFESASSATASPPLLPRRRLVRDLLQPRAECRKPLLAETS